MNEVIGCYGDITQVCQRMILGNNLHEAGVVAVRVEKKTGVNYTFFCS